MSSITTEKTIPVKVSVTAKLARSSAVLLGLLIVAVILSASVGAITVSPAMVAKVIANHLFSAPYAVSEPIDRIIWQIHIPRMLLGALV